MRNVCQNWNHRSRSRKSENFSKSWQFNYQKKMNAHTLCFCPLIKSFRGLKFWSGLKEVNGESRGHPISSVKYNFIFSRLQNTAFLKYAVYLINIFLYFITLYIINTNIPHDKGWQWEYTTWLIVNMTRPLVKSVYQKIFFLFLYQNICCEYSKEPSRWDGSYIC